MASGRKPGPTCFHNDQPRIHDGTSCLRESPKPGPIGVELVQKNKEQNLVFLITEALLHAVMPQLAVDKARNFIIPLHRYLDRYKINTLRRVSAFFGQVAVESAEFNLLQEKLNYKNSSRLHEIFPNRFKTADAAKEYTNSPEKLANFIYANKIGNGDVKSGDGWRYRGRGLLHLTGRYNYSEFSRDTSIDALNNPDLLTKPEYAVYSAAWFWSKNHLNDRADIKSYTILTKTINNACLQFSEREMYRKRASLLLLRAIVRQGF